MHAVAGAGPDEEAFHLRSTGWPILRLLEGPTIPGARLLPFTDPVPIYPWAMVYRQELHHPALAALVTAVDGLAGEEGWHELPSRSWFGAGDRELVDSLI